MQPRPDNDADLARRAKTGDVDAYAALVRLHQAAAIRLAFLICGADAEDVAQEAFVKAFRALDRFREGAPFRPWMLHIVANEARNRRRAAGRRARYELALIADPVSAGASPSAESEAVSAAGREALAAAVARLSPRHRDVIACRYLLDLSEAETGEVLGLPAGTVKSRLARGLTHLRATMEGEPHGR